MNVRHKLSQYAKDGKILPHVAKTLDQFFRTYLEAMEKRRTLSLQIEMVLDLYLELVIHQIKHPYTFQPFHRRIVSPTDYYVFGLELMRPLVVFESSRVLGLEQVKEMQKQLHHDENVILFGNHQTEPDPQIISLLLENSYSSFAREMIFVAGDRVISDPLAVPFSLGRNLLCIYSKKRMQYPPELKAEKQLHNQKTMKKMSELLAEGGKAIYVAPSGGRDRKGANGIVEVAPFDASSIEMFWLMAKHSGRPTHFYPLSLSTYDLLPPPQNLNSEMGETRIAGSSPAHLSFGEEIKMESFPGSDHPDKKARRQLRADYIWNLVKQDYHLLLS